MRKKILLFSFYFGKFILLVMSLVFVLALLFTSFRVNQASASSGRLTSVDNVSGLILQSTATPTPTLRSETTTTLVKPAAVYSSSLSGLGYNEITLNSPFGYAEYSFRIPESWLIQTDGLLELNLSYAYNQIDAGNYPTQFGDLTVKLDGQTLTIFSIQDKELDNYQLSIPLPAPVMASNETQHIISLEFSDEFLCKQPHQAALIIHPTSSISLNYSQRPLVPELARYPWPFYQQAFTPDIVRFVLPAHPRNADLTSAVGIAAKLGDLTSNREVISATTDLEFGRLISSSPVTNEHLIVVGTPQNNQMLALLNDAGELPVSLHQRQLELTGQGPTVVSPGDTFTYIFTITNVLDRPVHLSLTNPLPANTELMNCTPDCSKKDGNKVIEWNNEALEKNETHGFSVTLRATEVLTGALENTITVVDADLGPVNADTLASSVVADTSASHDQVSTSSPQGDYFFMYNGQAVAEGDGIIQEVLSPWSEDRAVLIITGLSDEAVRKASQAMSSEARFPGMNGSVALVRETLSPSETNQTASIAVENTLTDLGYQDKILSGQSPQPVDYYFRVPYGWQLTEPAGIDLYFSHSQLIDYAQSGVTVLLNGKPVTSLALNKETADNGHIHVSLVDSDAQVNQSNRLTIRVDMPLPAECVDPKARQAWFVIKATSKISLAHNEIAQLDLDLDYFPQPFHLYPALANLLFVLPDAPLISELDSALKLAASLGNSAGKNTTVPMAILDRDLSQVSLADYQIIAIGRPSRNTLLQEVNDKLPQPFLAGTDEIEQRLDDVIFRLSTDVDLGYLQLIPSPWQTEHALLAVTGTTDRGMQQAVQTLINRAWALNGNLALVRNDKVSTIDTRELTSIGMASTVATAVPEMSATTPTPAAAALSPTIMPTPAGLMPKTSTSVQASTTGERPSWLMPLVGINGLLVIGIFVFAFWRARQKRV
jgi:hypothetical protein